MAPEQGQDLGVGIPETGMDSTEGYRLSSLATRIVGHTRSQGPASEVPPCHAPLEHTHKQLARFMHFQKARPHPERGHQPGGWSGENSAPSLHPSRTQADGPQRVRRGWKAWQGPGEVAGAPRAWRALCWSAHCWGSQWTQRLGVGGLGLVLPPPQPLPPQIPPHPHSRLPTPHPPLHPPPPHPPLPAPQEAGGQGLGSQAAVGNTRQIGKRVEVLSTQQPLTRDDSLLYLCGCLLWRSGLCGLRGWGHCLLCLPAVVMITGQDKRKGVRPGETGGRSFPPPAPPAPKQHRIQLGGERGAVGFFR